MMLSTSAPIFDGHFRTIVEAIDEAVYVVDAQRRIVYWNHAAEQLTGYSAREVVGWTCDANLLQHVDGRGEHLCVTQCSLHATLADGARRTARLFLRHKRGHRVPVAARIVALRDERGATVGAAEIFTSLAPNEHAESARDVQRMAFEDALTGLPNRRYVEKELTALLDRVRRDGRSVGVLMLDLDDFKLVNDRYGHATGDQALRVVANTVAANLRPVDVAGRWGGEEFVVLLPDATPATLAVVADRLRALVKRSRVALPDGRGDAVTVSGGATLALPSDTVESVIERADALLYASKHAGRDRISHDLSEAGRDSPPRNARRSLAVLRPPRQAAADAEESPPSTVR